MAGDSDNSSSSPNKRLKTLIVTTPSTSSECKSKIQCDLNQYEQRGNQQSETSSPSRGCSICFLEDGKSIRGEINCCDHYFCFLCIMEWAKIESRCPMCRRRFNTSRRPPKVGLFARERIVRIPVRDQVNFHLGTLPCLSILMHVLFVMYAMEWQTEIFCCCVIFVIRLLIHTVLDLVLLYLKVIGFAMTVLFLRLNNMPLEK